MSRTRYVDPSEFVKPKFTYPEVPKDVPVGTCGKCGGSTRAEEFQSWTKLEGLTKKRVFRCIQHGHRCPAVTITVGQEDESMAKPKVIAQTPEWCARMKAACVKKHIRYQDLGAACGLSESTLAQSLNMHSTLSEAAQKAVEQAIEDYTDEPPQSVKARNMAKVRAAKAKPKSETQKAFEPPSASLEASESVGKMADAMAKETEETILRNLEAQEALPPGATVTWGEEAPKPGLIQPSEELVVIDVTGPTTFLEEPTGLPTGTGRAEVVVGDLGGDSLEGCGLDHALDAEEIDLLAKSQILTPGEASRAADERMEKRPVGSTERHMLAMVSNYYDLVQQKKNLECKIDGVAELYYGLEQRHRALECRVQSVAEQAEQRNLDLEDRLTSTYDHLTEHMANLQVVNAVVGPQQQDDELTYWIGEQPLSLDRILKELSVYSDSQLAALVTAATARRDLLKAMEAA